MGHADEFACRRRKRLQVSPIEYGPHDRALVFAVSCAFAGPLLSLTGEGGGGFHYRGNSSLGKTTAQLVSGSVWGGDSSKGYLQSWRATINGFESISEIHNHGLLCLDEIGQCDPREVGEAAYMLANGIGKARMSRGLTSRRRFQWDLIFLSSGESGLSELDETNGKRIRGGQSVRMCNQCRKKHWHYAFSVRGVRYRGSIPEARIKPKAEEAENKIKREIFEGRYGRPSGDRSLSEFIRNEYLPWARENKRSWSHDEFRVRAICESPLFKNKTFAQVTPGIIERFKKERRESMVTFRYLPSRQRSPASVNRELELLSKIFSLSIQYRVTDENPMRKVQLLPENNKRIRYLKDEEEPRLLEALTSQRAHLRPLVIIALGTGMRYGDQVNLHWEQVDFQRNLIYVPNSKTGQDYGVPMNQDVRRELQALKKTSGQSEHVFINPKTGIRYQELKRAFHTALLMAGINNFRWHDLRHTFGTRLGEAGYNAYEIAELMGHASIKTSERYVHPVETRKREAVEATIRTGEKTCHIPATEVKEPPLLVAVNS